MTDTHETKAAPPKDKTLDEMTDMVMNKLIPTESIIGGLKLLTYPAEMKLFFDGEPKNDIIIEPIDEKKITQAQIKIRAAKDMKEVTTAEYIKWNIDTYGRFINVIDLVSKKKDIEQGIVINLRTSLFFIFFCVDHVNFHSCNTDGSNATDEHNIYKLDEFIRVLREKTVAKYDSFCAQL
ncbi:MAG: hypothetical protein Hyperionvirus1_28 [Hyperionvirus sp.]|uniref:Uncharacterized protein n=1 Tax=Hyperionvirus sp. TaxID=2487770 RepID=A0A3G5AAT7_9VIRU|nr:MAG: hypothetical protein Hyperionvirus1_28 [Hyperionvirus sp.]